MDQTMPTAGAQGAEPVKSSARRARAVARVAPPPSPPRASASAPKPARREEAWLPWVVLGAIVVIIGAHVVYRYAAPFPRSKAWQAVFLTNGQTYFGHITRSYSRALVLRDVYYLQTQAAATEAGQGASVGSSTTLVKLGDELHGPTDAMRINPEHVLFTETMRDDAMVVRAIARERERAAAKTNAPETDTSPTSPVPPAPPAKK